MISFIAGVVDEHELPRTYTTIGGLGLEKTNTTSTWVGWVVIVKEPKASVS